MPWISQSGHETEEPSEYAQAIGEAILNNLGQSGGLTVTKTINNITVQDFQARPIWYANYHAPPPEPEDNDGA